MSSFRVTIETSSVRFMVHSDSHICGSLFSSILSTTKELYLSLLSLYMVLYMLCILFFISAVFWKWPKIFLHFVCPFAFFALIVLLWFSCFGLFQGHFQLWPCVCEYDCLCVVYTVLTEATLVMSHMRHRYLFVFAYIHCFVQFYVVYVQSSHNAYNDTVGYFFFFYSAIFIFLYIFKSVTD